MTKQKINSKIKIIQTPETNLYKYRYSHIPIIVALTACAVLWTLAISAVSQHPLSDGAIHTKIAQFIAGNDMAFADITKYQHVFAYPLYHTTVALCHLITGLEFAKASVLIQVFANTASILILRRLLIDQCNMPASYKVDAIALCAGLFLCAKNPLAYDMYYFGICGPNPIHNPTMLFVRPFGLMAVYWYLSFLRNYEAHQPFVKAALLWGISLVLSVIAKPSFATVFLAAMGIHVAIKMLKQKDWRIGIYSMLTVSPTLALMLVQLKYISAHSEALQTKIAFGSFMGFPAVSVLMITISLIPSVILLFNQQNIKNSNTLQIAVLAFAVSWMQMYFLTNGITGDYSWGYDLAVGFIVPVFLATLNFQHDRKVDNLYAGAALLVFSYQTYIGITYLIKCIETQNYMF